MTLEDIDDDSDFALLCMTNFTACCRSPGDSENGSVLGNWYFPNGTKVSSSGKQWDFHRTRGQMVVRMYRRRGGVEGIYRCEIPDSMNVTQPYTLECTQQTLVLVSDMVCTLLFFSTRVILYTV